MLVFDVKSAEKIDQMKAYVTMNPQLINAMNVITHRPSRYLLLGDLTSKLEQRKISY